MALKGNKFLTGLPTNIHLDLLRQNKIEDPYLGDNINKLKWISSCRVKYTKSFNVDKINWGRAT